MKILFPFLAMLIVACLFMPACQSASPDQVNAASLMDTVITEVRDTVITFYPETYEETVQVVTSYDTVITPHVPDQK